MRQKIKSILMAIVGLFVGAELVSQNGPLSQLGRWAYDRGFLRGLRARPVEPCRAYWGTHACKRPRGHRGGHRCDRGCDGPNPYAFGEDL